jgi:hypothetical protein
MSAGARERGRQGKDGVSLWRGPAVSLAACFAAARFFRNQFSRGRPSLAQRPLAFPLLRPAQPRSRFRRKIVLRWPAILAAAFSLRRVGRAAALLVRPSPLRVTYAPALDFDLPRTN